MWVVFETIHDGAVLMVGSARQMKPKLPFKECIGQDTCVDCADTERPSGS